MKKSKNKASGSKEFTFYMGKREHKIKVSICKSIFCKFFGLMFKTKSPNILFEFKKQKTLSIHSFFCKPFIAIWIDDKLNTTKIEDVRKLKINISGKGKYLLEIPSTNKEYKIYRRALTKDLNTI